MKKISIIIPIYNEKDTLLQILERVEKAPVWGLEKEILLIDDGSTDGTKKILKELESKYKIVYHKRNLGKGAAIRNGFKEASGDIIIIQDADLEYNPQDYPQLIRPILHGKADVVYGSRYSKKDTSFYKSHYWGVKLISWLTSLLYGSNLTDVYTCYKVFKSPVIKSINLRSNGFEIEQEMTSKLLNRKCKIVEVPITYCPRTFEEGKKINKWSNGLKAIWLIIKHRIIL